MTLLDDIQNWFIELTDDFEAAVEGLQKSIKEFAGLKQWLVDNPPPQNASAEIKAAYEKQLDSAGTVQSFVEGVTGPINWISAKIANVLEEEPVAVMNKLSGLGTPIQGESWIEPKWVGGSPFPHCSSRKR